MSPSTENAGIYTCPMHPQVERTGPGFCLSSASVIGNALRLRALHLEVAQ